MRLFLRRSSRVLACAVFVELLAARAGAQVPVDLGTLGGTHSGIRAHAVPGNLLSVLVTLGTYDASFRFTEIGQWTFGPL
jgi:hypothetical protein